MFYVYRFLHHYLSDTIEINVDTVRTLLYIDDHVITSDLRDEITGSIIYFTQLYRTILNENIANKNKRNCM